MNEDGEEVEAKRPAKSFKKMKKLEEYILLREVGDLQRQGLAGLERIVQLLKEDKLKMTTRLK